MQVIEEAVGPEFDTDEAHSALELTIIGLAIVGGIVMTKKVFNVTRRLLTK